MAVQIGEINDLLKGQQRFYVNAEDSFQFDDEPEFQSGGLSSRLGNEDRRMYGDIFADVPAWKSQDVAVGQ